MYGKSQSESEGWYPPTEWGWDGFSEQLSDADNGVVIFVAVYENAPSFITLRLFVSVNGGDINWGDGTTSSAITHNALIEHTFDFDGITEPVVSTGYKIAKVLIKTTGVLQGIVIGQYSLIYGTCYNTSLSVLALKARTQNSVLLYTSEGFNTYYLSCLQLLDFGNTTPLNGSNAGFNNLFFRNHTALQKLITVGFTSVNNWGYRSFEKCNLSGININFFDWSKVQYLYQTFYDNKSGSINRIFEHSILNCIDMYQCFYGSQCFDVILLSDTTGVTDIRGCIFDSSIKEFYMDDASSVTATLNFVRPTAYYNCLTSLLLEGLVVGIDISNQPMEDVALNAFFTSLGTASGSQTIVVTGCLGAATCDTSIATDKGFTVTT